MASLLIRRWDLDLIVARWFWSDAWQFRHHGAVKFLYDFGTVPALIAGLGGLGLWVASFRVTLLRETRRLGLFLFLCLAIGPGLLVNTVFKENFGRPRPRQVIEFGGQQEFRSVGEKPFVGQGKSFPSGHVSMGFFWLAPCLYFWRRHRKLACSFAAAALLQGGLMGFGRLAQGAHWLSDVLWSAGFVHLTSWLLWRALMWVNHPLVTRETTGVLLPKPLRWSASLRARREPGKTFHPREIPNQPRRARSDAPHLSASVMRSEL